MDLRESKAMFRYGVISPLFALDIPRGKRGELYRTLAERERLAPDGSVIKVSVDAIRLWFRLYMREGFEGLMDAPRPQRGSELPQELIDIAMSLKKEVPSRSINKIIHIMEEMGMAPKGTLRRSTLHRCLQKAGLSARKLKLADKKDLARWRKDHANDLWQSDMLEGPSLPDPEHPDRKRRARLYVFIDDASRLVLAGRFFFKNDLPALELVFKRALQRYGAPLRCYYDNGLTYRSLHMKLICADLGIHAPTFTRPYRPEGHGKIEAWNRFCTSDFLAEVSASSIATLEELNEIFDLWVENEYNDRVHSELKCTPRERLERDRHLFRYADEEKLRKAFLWRETRRVDKCAMISLFTREYRVAPTLAGQKVEARFNPEFLDCVEIWRNGKFIERVPAYQQRANRPARMELPECPIKPPIQKTDFLGFLRKKYGKDFPAHESHESPFFEQGLDEFIAIFADNVPESVFDCDELVRFWIHHGPFDLNAVKELLENPTLKEAPYLHISCYLESLKGGTQ